MNVPQDHPLTIARGLLQPDAAIALAAIAALRGRRDRIARDGFIDLLDDRSRSRVQAVLQAIGALADDYGDDEAAAFAIDEAIEHPSPAVRWTAIQAARRRTARPLAIALEDRLARRLGRDESWLVRREALSALADSENWAILQAADDPHWRVRFRLLQVLLAWGRDDERRADIDRRLAAADRGASARIQGVRAYSAWRWTGDPPPPSAFPKANDPDDGRSSAIWDWDPAVLARSLRRLGDSGRRGDLATMAALAGHPEEGPRRLAIETLRSWGRPEHLVEALRWLDDPRRGAAPDIAALINGLDFDRVQAMLRRITALEAPSPAQSSWRELQESDEDEPAPIVRPPDHPQSRAEALTLDQAERLIEDPTGETSWRVLAQASRMTKRPIWRLAPRSPWRPPDDLKAPLAPIAVTRIEPPGVRFLGPNRLPVCPLGISGHYAMPAVGFARAVAAGVNVLFWEPNYAALTEFSARIAASDRASLHFVAGTFEASSDRVRRDVERALRSLRIERLTLFLLFWTRAWSRIDDELRRTLDDLRDAGKIAEFGLSTHNRSLALEAIESGWDPVMIRHSAGHRGAEEQVIPAAQARGTSLITFNSLSYGRLLRPIDGCGIAPPTAADCYRYSLTQPAVRLCFSAPSSLEQLAENLDVHRDSALPEDRREALLAFGSAFYREETLFRRLIREL